MNYSRLYSCSDAVFIGWVSRSINLIKEEHSRFAAFSIIFSPERLQEIELLTDNASSIPSDKVYIDIQAQATENVTVSIEACAKFFQTSKFDIENVFPNKKHIWNQFGFNDYEAARKSGRAMYMFYSDFILIANLHKAAMTESTWTEDTFTKIADLKDSLKLNMDHQIKCKVDRGRATDDRIETLNKIYEMLSKYMKAAKIIYANNEEMLRWFKFPVARNTKSESPELEEETV
jgi:hypothetical protein